MNIFLLGDIFNARRLKSGNKITDTRHDRLWRLSASFYGFSCTRRHREKNKSSGASSIDFFLAPPFFPARCPEPFRGDVWEERTGREFQCILSAVPKLKSLSQKKKRHEKKSPCPVLHASPVHPRVLWPSIAMHVVPDIPAKWWHVKRGELQLSSQFLPWTRKIVTDIKGTTQ